tara:strand:+ start:2938 stop:3354 length:417 start_codon:yes stop_codon:yes gene_type:complete
MSETELITHLLSYKRGNKVCEVHPIDRNEWRSWAASVYAQSVRDAETANAELPMLIASWMAMRAKRHGWEDLFASWADRAHKYGLPEKEKFRKSLFIELDARLLVEERYHQAFRSFKDTYEETMGFPLSKSDLANKEA